MRIATLSASAALLLGATACGKPNYIEQTKKARLSDCPGHSIGEIVNNHVGTASWAVYPTGNKDLVRVIASGKILHAGVAREAKLEFLYRQSTREATLLTVRFDGQEQMQPIADALVEEMCEAVKQ